MKKNKLYTITKGNLFAFGDTLNVPVWNNPYANTMGGNYSFGNTGLKAPDYTVINWGNPSNTSQLMQGNKEMISNLGSSNQFGKYETPKNSFFSNQAVQQGLGFAANMADQIPTGDKRGLYDTLDPMYHLAGGKESAVGNGLSDVGVGLFKTGAQSGNGWLMLAGAGAKVLGGGWNALFGIGTDKDKLKSAQAGIDYYKNFRSNAYTYDDVEDLVSMGSFQNPYSGGLFKKGKADSMNKELASTWNWNKDWAERDRENNIYNIGQDMQNEFWRNYSAFGGPIDGALGIMQDDKYIDAINNRSNAISKAGTFAQQTPTFGNAVNRFADGGGIHIKPSHKRLFTEKANRAGMGVQEYASHVLANKENYPASTVKQANFAKNAAGWKHDDGGFVNSFLQDPVQAAMQYIQQQDALEAQQAAQQEAMAQQQAYDDLVTRLQATETQNQGLQALLDSQASDIRTLQELQAANHINSEAANYANEVIDKAVSKGGSKNWNYIEDKLRKSGKFNDVQIAGIKLNLQRESGFNPTAVGDGGKAYGLAQWHPDRQPKDRSMDGQINHLINTLSAFDGSKHWVGRSNYEGFLNARTPEEAHYYIAKGFERPAASITDKLRNASNMSLRRLRAFGGELGTNGTDFTNGLLEINAGSSHEDNPYQGVQLGVDSQGVPNLVEEGETVFNDYVYSNRMNVPSFMKKELGLGGNKNQDITFAEASKKLAEASVERPNNPIDQAGLEASLGKLAQVQEAERMKMQAEQQNIEAEEYLNSPMNAYGGNLFVTGGPTRKPTDEELQKIIYGDGTSFTRRIFGDTAFTRFMENVGQAVEDPINYFAGDELEAITSKLSKMSKPAVDRFFKTSAGQAVAKVIVWADDNLSTNSTAREAGMRPSKAMLKAGSRVSKAVVDGARRSMRASQLAARGQIGNSAAPMARGQNPAIAQGIEKAQAAKKAAATAAYNKKLEDAGFKLVQNGEKAASTVTRSGYSKIDPKAGRGVAGTTGSYKLNPKTASRASASKAAPESYPGAAGSVPFDAGSIGTGPAKWWAAGLGVPIAAAGTVHAYNWMEENDRKHREEVMRASMPGQSKRNGTVYTDVAGNVHNTRAEAVAANEEIQRRRRGTVSNNSPQVSQKRDNGLFYATNGWGYKTQAAADIASKKYNAEVAAYRASQAKKNAQSSRAQAASQNGTPTTPRAAMNTNIATPNRGDIVGYKYDWYRNGDDGTGNHWGFTPDKNGIIDVNTGYTDDYRNLVSSLTADDIRAWAAAHPNDPSLLSFLKNNGPDALKNLTTDQWRRGATDGKYGFMHHVAAQIGNPDVPIEEAATPAAPQSKVYHLMEGEDGDYISEGDAAKYPETRRVTDDQGNVHVYHKTPQGNNVFTEEQLNEGVNNVGRNPGNGNPKPYDTWMRYAPAVGAGIMTLTDALGLTNKSDYTYPDKLEAAAQQAGYAPRVHPWFIGDYMRPKVFDTLYYANQLQANSRATDRALANNAAPIGTRMAGMLANNYNTQLGLGDLYRKGEEFNQAQEERRKEFNRKTNMFNAQMGMDAELANARQQQQAASSYMSGLAQAAAMRDSIDSRIGAARSANITNLLNNLGMIGRENFAFNQINSDRSRRNAVGRNGWSWDKIADAYAQGNSGAFGGEVEKYYNKKRQGRRK